MKGCKTKPLRLRVTAQGSFLDNVPVFPGDAKTEGMLEQLFHFFGPDKAGLIMQGTLTCRQQWDLEHPDYMIPKPGYPSDVAVKIPHGSSLGAQFIHAPFFLPFHPSPPFSLFPAPITISLFPSSFSLSFFSFSFSFMLIFSDDTDGGWTMRLFRHVTAHHVAAHSLVAMTMTSPPDRVSSVWPCAEAPKDKLAPFKTMIPQVLRQKYGEGKGSRQLRDGLVGAMKSHLFQRDAAEYRKREAASGGRVDGDADSDQESRDGPDFATPRGLRAGGRGRRGRHSSMLHELQALSEKVSRISQGQEKMDQTLHAAQGLMRFGQH